MTLVDAFAAPSLLPIGATAWAAALLLAAGFLAARQWGFGGLLALAATLPGARAATDAEHRQRVRRADAERLALAAPAMIGAVGAIAATLAGQPLLLAGAALLALPCALGTARFCIHAFGAPGLLPGAAAVAAATGAFAAGALLGVLALPLLFAREGRWTLHLLVQAPLLGARRLAGAA